VEKSSIGQKQIGEKISLSQNQYTNFCFKLECSCIFVL